MQAQKQYAINRELKQKASPELIKAIKVAKKGYGAMLTLSKYAGVTRAAINYILTQKKCTPSMAAKIKAGIAQWELEKEMASAE